MRSPSKNLIVLRVQGNVVFFQVVIQVICAQDLRNLDQLVIIVVTMEERLLPEDL